MRYPIAYPRAYGPAYGCQALDEPPEINESSWIYVPVYRPEEGSIVDWTGTRLKRVKLNPKRKRSILKNPWKHKRPVKAIPKSVWKKKRKPAILKGRLHRWTGVIPILSRQEGLILRQEHDLVLLENLPVEYFELSPDILEYL